MSRTHANEKHLNVKVSGIVISQAKAINLHISGQWSVQRKNTGCLEIVLAQRLVAGG